VHSYGHSYNSSNLLAFILILMFIVHRTSLTQDFFLSYHFTSLFSFYFQNVYVPTLEEEGSECFRLGALLQSVHRSWCDCHGDHRVDNTDCTLEDDEAAEEEALGSRIWSQDPRSGVRIQDLESGSKIWSQDLESGSRIWSQDPRSGVKNTN
jgi:hypothetical protein